MNQTLSVARGLAFLTMLAGVLSLPPAQAQTSSTDPIAHARELATSGHRPEALSLLKERLEQSPTDTDARTLYGIVLSWDGHYDEAREELRQVLANTPEHGDALPALINIELWSNHPERAEQLARQALEHQPNNTNLLLLQARALRDMHEDVKALHALDRILALEPANEQARDMRRTLDRNSRTWEFNTTHDYLWFSGGRASQHETSVQLKSRTPIGSIIGRESRADRFSSVSYQSEIDFYPHIRPGTYGYLNVGHSFDANLYPRYRFGADIFQGFGHGFEGSGGMRRLKFSTGVNIYTFALARYYGNWLYTGRAYLTPGKPGVSRTGVLTARRFFSSDGLHDYIELHYSRGASLAQARTTANTLTLNSQKFSIDADKSVGNFNLELTMGAERGALLTGGNLNTFSIVGSVYYRFR